MSVYIKGMDMPTIGRILITLPSGRTLEVSADSTQNILREAQAVPVPPHGRLGDLDAFESIKYELPDGQKAFNRGFHSGVQYVQRLIMDAPTVLEAEPPKGETDE